MKKKFIINLFTFFYIFFCFHVYADQKKIVIEGNERISKETILVYGDIKLDKNINELEKIEF